MPKYIIEREIPNAGALSAKELRTIAQRSCAVLKSLGPEIQWIQSYVTEDKIRWCSATPDYSRRFPVSPNDAACAAACCRSGAALNASD